MIALNNKLVEFMKKPELRYRDLPSLNDIPYAIRDTLNYWLQNQNNSQKSEIEIIPENMLNYEVDRVKNYEKAVKAFQEFIRGFYANLTPDQVDIQKMDLMVNGSTLPVKVSARLTKGNDKIDKTVFVKKFDYGRLFGLLFYNSIAGINDYGFVFNENGIVEEQIPGKHSHQFEKCELSDLVKKDEYIKERIKLDLLSFYLGLDDVVNPNNHLITKKGRIYVIDFDVMGEVYNEMIRENIKNNTANELNITRKKYDTIFNRENMLLIDRIKSEKDILIPMLDCFWKLEYEGICSHLNISDIEKNINELIRNE